jgi:RimJ/RimL family protein N-acetyltransferase
MEDTERLVSSWLKKRKHCSWALDLHGEAIGELEIIKDLKDGGFMFGYILRADQWGQGYMSEALETVLDYMFQNGFRYAYAETDERNTRSRQLLERNGFILTGREEGRFIAKKNERVNIVSYRKEKSI